MTRRTDKTTNPAPIGHNGGPPLDDRPRLIDSFSMNTKNACRVTGLGKDTLYELNAQGLVRSFLVGAKRLWETSSLHEYVERRASEPTTLRRSPQTRTRNRPGSVTEA
jgi:excisionase family DNA binding protein